MSLVYHHSTEITTPNHIGSMLQSHHDIKILEQKEMSYKSICSHHLLILLCLVIWVMIYSPFIINFIEFCYKK